MVDKAEETTDEITLDEPREAQVIDSKYRKIILAAQRSKQLQRGATARIDMDLKKHKPTRVAMQELEDGFIHFDKKTVK
jgi:DNA-directed RNA polymerase omega subunit